MARTHRTVVGVIGCLLLTIVGLIVVPTPHASAAPSLPPGFVLRDQAIGQSAGELTDFGYLPDGGGILSTGKRGGLVWAAPDGRTHTLATLPVNATQDLGLIGLAIAPDYATSRQIYIARSVPTGTNTYLIRLARWTVTGSPEPTGLAQERVLFDVPGDSVVHGITGIVAARDGTVWVSVGDVADYRQLDRKALRALDRNALQGKILRLTPDGQGVPGNPYYDPANPSATRSKVYASGFRSPFRLSLDPATGQPVVGDVGWSTWEEVDVVQPGGNYAWPCWEGNHRTPSYSALPECANVVNTPPLWEYHHGDGVDQGNSVTGGIVYEGTSYPQAYRGAYFFGDYSATKLWSLRYDAQGRLTQRPQSPPFGTGIGRPVKFGAAPNGDVVYADIGSGRLTRLSYTEGNTTPVAKASSSTDPGTRTVSFDASESVDFDGDPLTYRWDFGDGTTGTGVRANHTYAPDVTRATARLTVTDALGASDTTTITVAPANRSPQLWLSPPGEANFAINEPVRLAATATDAEDGELPISWTTTVLHCPSEATCHDHPGHGGSGATFSLPFTDHHDSRMTFTATVTDSAGVSSSATYVAWPRERRLTLLSNVPAALRIPIEGGGNTAMVTEGATVEVVASDTAADGASRFSAWTDGSSSRTRSVTMGGSDVTLTARYLSPLELRYNAEPALRQLLGAPTGPEIIDGGVRYRGYERGRLYASAQTGTHEIHGAILAKYLSLGGHNRFGPPSTDQTSTPDRVGRFNHFPGTPATLRSSIYWTPGTGAHAIWGKIRERWAALGWEKGPLGYPKSDELIAPDGRGRFNHFAKGTGGSIYWTASTGAHDVRGSIRQRWAARGWERSYLGYPTTGEFGISGGRRNNFRHGFISWYSRTGTTVDRRY
ncbi:MAG: PKD domain-containing protein [Pseudonocardiaceae bacterium]|nr:PKD domain-containing protein [Pseudonocardiaceae bacterium]